MFLLKKAIQTLQPELLQVIEMHYFEDISQREIAKKLGVSEMVIHRRMKKAMGNLFKYIQSEGGVQ